MKRVLEILTDPETAQDETKLADEVSRRLRLKPSDELEINILRRSIDARSRRPVINILLEAFVNEKPEPESPCAAKLMDVSSADEVIIVGSGPAGYFAALELIELGLKPVIFDRGKDARSRRKDLRSVQQFSIVNPDSNYCFGEGGAGTYSDGKLYTRSHKRGDISKALKIFVEHGAHSDILIDAHPHIGSNKLPVVIQNMRKTITECGGEVHFQYAVTDIVIHEGACKGVIVNGNSEHCAEAVILCTGHSARDVYEILLRNKIRIEYKPFAVGVRIEHPQELIDEIQYNQNPRDPFLPAASYKLTAQAFGRGVYSFCMCPGGLIVPSATAPGELVVNGMSMSRRDSRFANSGIVVSIDESDLEDFSRHGEVRGLEFQKELEQRFFRAGDGSQSCPAQRVTDFLEDKLSATLPSASYIPGVYSYMLSDLLPAITSVCLKQGLVQFEKKMKGFITDEAQLVGLESRTSSPVRIPRDNLTREHVQLRRLFPCGEGAGYAGGIISAALDGQNTARAVSAVLRDEQITVSA